LRGKRAAGIRIALSPYARTLLRATPSAGAKDFSAFRPRNAPYLRINKLPENGAGKRKSGFAFLFFYKEH
jgi:hypothetical protein